MVRIPINSIGLGLFKQYAAREGYTVIGTILPLAEKIPEIPIGKGSKAIIVNMDVTDVQSPKRAIEELETKYGINQIDIAISNAGILTLKAMSRIENIDPQEFEDHWRVNVKGYLLFFQASLELLKSGSKFIFISSSAAILDRIPDKQNVCYGITKIGATYLARYAHFEHPDLIIFPICPGWVATGMGNLTAQHRGWDKAPVTVEQSASGLIKVIDEATRETHSGKPWN
uniref:Uncharacterized protein n=1 Tax=Kwoniella pini CBS 10737 TaxID=1296096 RepID=A0A1B9I0G7_9TREE|nr:uncharacterized protein I206_04716 [Kwoniella pini CBS 10737]OCF49029.1 hypothetical protein I206_04716 [Kwoniella pini CBS 10737]